MISCLKCDKPIIRKKLCNKHYLLTKKKAYACPHTDRPMHRKDGLCKSCCSKGRIYVKALATCEHSDRPRHTSDGKCGACYIK